LESFDDASRIFDDACNAHLTEVNISRGFDRQIQFSSADPAISVKKNDSVGVNVKDAGVDCAALEPILDV
jgi:hypothetical protein